MADTTTLDAITKKFYMNEKVINQVHAKSVLYDKLAKPAQTDVLGKEYTYAVRKGKNRYAGRGIAESGDYGTAGSQATANVVVPNAEIVTPIELSGRIVNAATGANKGAFVSAFRMETEWGMTDTVQALNRQLQSDGTDALAYWTAADDTSGTNVDDGQGNAFPIHLEDGATTLDLVDASDLANLTILGDDIVVTKGAEGASSVAVTWTGTVSGSADGDFLVMAGTLGKQMMGIAGVISDEDPPLLSVAGLHGRLVASNSDWKAQVFDASANRALTLALLQAPLTQIGLRSSASEADIEFMMSNGYVKDKLIELLIADQRHVNVTKLKGGQTSVDFNGKPLIVDAQCKRNRVYYVNPESMDFLTASGGIGWADFDGSKWVKKIGTSGYASAYQAFIRIEGNLAVKQRNANAVLTHLSD